MGGWNEGWWFICLSQYVHRVQLFGTVQSSLVDCLRKWLKKAISKHGRVDSFSMFPLLYSSTCILMLFPWNCPLQFHCCFITRLLTPREPRRFWDESWGSEIGVWCRNYSQLGPPVNLMRLSLTSGPLPLQTYVRARVIHPVHIIVNEPRARIRKDRRLNPSVLCCTDDIDTKYATPPLLSFYSCPICHPYVIITAGQWIQSST